MTQENLLARYTVLHELGRGATGAVYAARDRTTGAVVALKRLDPAWVAKSGADFPERFRKFARSARHLAHPNIVTIHEAGEAAGTAYVAVEMLEGESLRKVLDAGPLPVARAIRIAREIAAGLEHAHLQGVVHGNLKPSSIILLRSGAAKITDFELRGEAVDHRVDVFSLGALLYEMLAHRLPEQTAQAKPTPPSTLNPHVPRALDRIVLGMLAAAPEARTPGVPIVLRDLQRLEEGLGVEPGAPPTEPEPAPPMADREVFDYQKAIALMERESRQQPPQKSRPAIFAALAVALVALGAGLAAFMTFVPERSERIVAASRPPEAPPTPPEEPRLPTPPPPPVAEAAKEPQPLPAPVAEQQPESTARLIVAVSPHGELYIDGQHQGTTPPITTFALEPGMRRIEVRSGSRKPFLTYMTVQAGEVRRIRHDFDARPSSPPGRRRIMAGQ
jgi:hypothetical protein